MIYPLMIVIGAVAGATFAGMGDTPQTIFASVIFIAGWLGMIAKGQA